MERIIQTISTFPTVPLTVLLGVVVAYWIFALVTGAAFDHGDAVAGGMKAAGDATTGALKGAGDAVVGSIKGSVQGLGDGDADLDGDGAGGGLLAMLGLAKVPVTITGSVMLLVAWTLCALVSLSFEPGALLGGLLLAGSFVAGLLGAAVLLRPLNKALSQSRPATRRDALGQVCTITSGKVDGAFGTAHVDDGGAGLNVHVICPKSNTLKKGDRAILVDFDAAKETYEVEPVDWLLPQELEALNDPTRAAHVISGRVRRR